MPNLYDMLPEGRRSRGIWWSHAWSLVNGCSYISAGCEHCWAARLSRVRSGHPNAKISGSHVGLTTGRARWTGRIRVAPDQLDKPLSIKRGAVFAVWNDLFHADVPMGFRDRAFNVMRRTPRHAYIVLTKRPGLMAEYIEDALVLPNVFLGTSVENTEQAGVRMPDMRRIAGYRPGERWKTVICCEPLLGSVSGVPGARVNEPLPAWVIAGAETGSGFRPMEFAWAEGLRRRCNTAGIPFWFKTWNNGVRLLGARTWSETPEIPEVEA